MSILLYYVPQTRAVRVRWMLEEMNHPYELIRLDPRKDENDRPEYRALQPLGHVPVVVAGDKAIYESAAIVAWLADRHPEKKLAPPVDAPERGHYYQWLFFGMATVEPPLQQIFNHTRSFPEEKRVPAIVDQAKERFREVAAVVEKEMSSKPYILGDAFSAADVVLGGCINWGRAQKMLDGFPALRDYSTRLIERPAFQRAIAD
jgi:glutathione S-transferase